MTCVPSLPTEHRYCCLDVSQMGAERPEMVAQLMRFIMDSFAKGTLKPIRVDQVFEAPKVLEAFRYMQQGKHIGKIVLGIRDQEGKPLVQNLSETKRTATALQLDSEGSYLLVGGLGGLGRSVSVWMVERGARHLVFLSRSAGSGPHDAEFVRELESMDCSVQLVKGDVSNSEDVTRAVNQAPAHAPLKGIIQMSMVLRDQMFDGMGIEDWDAVTKPKVTGTWNLHNATLASNINLDFFVLFSSLSGIIGQVGQANYASANTFLDAFVHYRTGLGLPCTAIDIGAVEGVGYLAQAENQDLLRKMQGSGWRAVQEPELLDALQVAMMPSKVAEAAANRTFILGLAPTIPLSSPQSSSRLRSDARMAVYHNFGADTGNGAGSKSVAANTAANSKLRALMASIRKDPSILSSDETADLLAVEIGRKLYSLGFFCCPPGLTMRMPRST